MPAIGMTTRDELYLSNYEAIYNYTNYKCWFVIKG